MASRAPHLIPAFLFASCSLALPQSAAQESAPPKPPERALRIGVVAREGRHHMLTPLVYWGAFTTKSAVFEPLVACREDGELEPRLARAWDVSPDGLVYTLHLRAGVRCHDGTLLDADAVRSHLRHWAGTPGHDWLGSTRRMQNIEALDTHTVRVTLSKPWNFLRDLQVVNPAYFAAPGSYGREGEFVTPVGTGPYRVIEHRSNDSYLLARHDDWWGGRPEVDALEMVTLPWLTKHASGVMTNERIESPEMLRWLLEGHVDLVADDEAPLLPRARLEALSKDARFRVYVRDGSTVNYLLMNTRRGPFVDRELRRVVAHAIDRDRLVQEGELGYARPCTTLYRPGCAQWPAEAGETPRPVENTRVPSEPVVLLLAPSTSPRLHRRALLIVEMLAAVGLRVQVLEADSNEDFSRRTRGDEYDLLFRATHGAPYDPWTHVAGMFLRDEIRMQSARPNAAANRHDAELVAHCLAAEEATTDAERRAAFARAQARLTAEVPLLPLLIPHRVAVARAYVEGLEFAANGYDLGLASVRLSAK